MIHLLDNYYWQNTQNNQFTNRESPQRPPQPAQRSKKKTSAACQDSEIVKLFVKWTMILMYNLNQNSSIF